MIENFWASSFTFLKSSLPVPSSGKSSTRKNWSARGFQRFGRSHCASFSRHGANLSPRQLVQHDQPLALFLVGHAGDDKCLLGHAGQFVQLFLHLDVRHHFAADFAEAAQTVGDLQKAILVHRRDVAGDVPAVAQHLGGFLRFGRDSRA